MPVQMIIVLLLLVLGIVR